MAFFLIVPSVMIVSILLVHALANRLGLRIYYTTLIATALLSFMVVFASIFVVPVAGRDYLLRLGLLVAAAAFLVTLANNFLHRKELDEERRFTEEVKAAYAAEVHKDALTAKADEPFDDVRRYNEPDKSTVTAETTDKTTDADLLLMATDKPTVKAETTDKPADADLLLMATDKPTVTAETTDKTADADLLLMATDKPTVTAETTDKPADADLLLMASDKPTVTAETTDKTADADLLLMATDKPTVKAETTDKTADADLLLMATDKPTVTAETTDKTADADLLLMATDKPTVKAETTDKTADADLLLMATDKPTVTAEDATLDAEPDSSGKFPLDKVFKPLAEVKPAEADKPVELKETPNPADKFPLDEVFKPLPEVKPAEADKPIKPADKPKRVEMFPLQEVFTPLSNIRLDKIEELTQEQREASPPKPPTDDTDTDVEETLDDILDKAYNERSKGHIWQAIDLYKKALERYRNDDYAPFVAIDLGNVYKEQALYSKAIKIYEEALSLPMVKRNPDIKHEFKTNLAYLRVVRDVLLKYHALSTPFDKLSNTILNEVDTEFKKVQINFRD